MAFRFRVPFPQFSLGFGLEKVGILTLDRPRLVGAVMAVLAAITVYGLFNVSFDQNMRDIFAGDTETYRTFVSTTRDLSDPENELLVLVEGDRLGEPAVFPKLQEFGFEIQLTDGVGAVFSAFSLRRAPDAAGDMPAVVADAAKGLTPDLLAAIRTHPLLGQKLVSADGKVLMYVVTPSVARATLDQQRDLRDRIEATAATVLAGTGATVRVTGFPAVRLSIVDLLIRDQLVLNGVGLVIGFAMSLILFRSRVAAVMTALPGAFGGIAVIGWTGVLGLEVTVLTNVVPALVMIIGYADAMHLNYAWRRHRDAGASPVEAERRALEEVAPACMLTAITTTVAFLSLTFSDIGLIRNFGWIGAAGVMAGGAIVLVVHAFLATLIGHRWRVDRSLTESLFGWLAGPSAVVGRFSARFAWPITIAALALVGVFGSLYLQLPPEHSVREHLPMSHPANAALGTIDDKLGGVFPVDILVPLRGLPPGDPASLERIAKVHEAVAAVDGVHTPLSLWSVAEWVGGDDPADRAERVNEVLSQMEDGGRRFSGRAGAVVTVNVTDAPTPIQKDLIGRIEAAAHAADPEAIVTGATVVTSREATRTIAALNWNLLGDVVAALVVMVIAFRLPAIFWLALIPNVLPLLATGAFLYFLDRGLQFTTVVALTIAYGIAVDDTVHYLNALIRGERAGDVRQRVVATARRIGPVIIGTSLVIIAGLSTTVTSSLPGAYLFGQLVMITLAVGVLGDLIILPALIAGPGKRWFGIGKSAVVAEAESAGPAPASRSSS